MKKLKTSQPVTKTTRKWNQESIDALGGCFVCTDWTVFDSSADLDLYRIAKQTVRKTVEKCKRQNKSGELF